MADESKSPSFSLTVADVVEITKNTALVACAGLTYLGENLAHLDLGNMGVMLVPCSSSNQYCSKMGEE